VIDTGQVYHATLTIKGQSAPPSSAVLVITLPDSTTVTPVVGPGTASGADWLLSYDYATVQAGLHKAAWQTTGPGTAATDYFNVRSFVSVLSLAEAKAHLVSGPAGSAATWTGDDDELRNFLQAVTEVIESKVGICVQRTFTQRVTESGPWELVLTRYPVISVTSVQSVWQSGPSWTTAQLLLDGDAGIVGLKPPVVLPFYLGPWDVTYIAGRAVVGENILHAAKELLRHLWETQRGQLQAQPFSDGESFTTSSGWAFSVPNRVLEMLAGDMTPAI
jgi:hypothetical protein